MLDIVCKFSLLAFSCSLFFNHGVRANDKDNNNLVIEPIAGRFEHGEGPHWDHRSKNLYIVDITAQKICKYNPEKNEVTCANIKNGPVGVVVPVEAKPNKFVVGSGKDFLLVNWDSNQNDTNPSYQELATVDQNRNSTRWNDGKVDSLGRFWGGTIGPEVNDVVVPNQATLYCIDSDLKPQIKQSPVTNSNGLAWNLQDNVFYYIDTPTRQVAAFNYEPISGTISNKTIAFDLEKHNISGLPDGMTIDRNGNLWVALYNGGGVVNVNPHTGNVIRTVKMPAEKVTSVTFGGHELETMFVTTSSRDLTEEERAQQPHAGFVFAVHGLGVSGLAANSFKC